MKRRGILALVLCAALLTGCGAKTAPGAGETADTTAAAQPTAPTPEAVPAAAAAEETLTSAAEETPAPTPEAVAEPEPAEEEITRSDGVHADTDFDDMHWEVYDMEPFREAAEALGLTDDPEEAERLYRWMLGEYDRLRTYSELMWIDFYSRNDPEGNLSELCSQTDDMLSEAADLLYAAVSDALEGPAGDAVTELVGEEAAEELSDYENMTDRERELLNRETELVLEYNETCDRTDLSEPSMNYRLGSIFLELVKIRNELAEIYGYDSYAQYAYESIYARDYTPEDAAELCRRIKPYARRYYAECYYSGVFRENLGRFSAGKLLDLLEEYAARISPEAARARQYMVDHGLWLMDSSNNIAGVGYTTVLPMYNAPFLFDCLYGSVYDLMSVFHEFGHYYDAFVNPEPEGFADGGSYDVFEIHSTSLEAMLYFWLDEIVGDNADKVRIYCLDNLIDNVVSGCVYDEFLQYAYAHPDMSVEEVNRAFREIASSYGREFYWAEDAYRWMYINHNFESPFYYISYAASTLASIQIWDLAREDQANALEVYNEIIRLGAYEHSYEEVLTRVGLKLFTEDLDGIMSAPCAALEELCRAYDEGLLDAA